MSYLCGFHWFISFVVRLYETNYKFCQQVLLKTDMPGECHVLMFAALWNLLVIISFAAFKCSTLLQVLQQNQQLLNQINFMFLITRLQERIFILFYSLRIFYGLSSGQHPVVVGKVIYEGNSISKLQIVI